MPWLGGFGCYGVARGVLVVWDKRSLELLDKEVGSFSVSSRFKNVNNGFVWIFFLYMVLFLRMADPSSGKN